MKDKWRVILIDDEVLIRKLIRMKIDWDALDMEVIAEYSSSAKALEQVEGLKPDIIITDICMPGMDGIEFSEECINIMPQVKIVILTGHNEFNYAMQSIKIGVADYILKPVNAENITKTLKQVSEKIAQERAHRREYEKLISQIEDNLPAFREKYLNQILHKTESAEVFCRKMKYYHVELNPQSAQIQAAVMEIDIPMKESLEFEAENNEIILYLKARELTEEFFSGDSYFLFCRDGVGRIVIICNNERIPLLECFNLLKKMLITRLKCYVNIGMSSVKKDYGQIAAAYGEAVEALKHKVIEGNNCIICYDHLEDCGKRFSNEEESVWNEAQIYILAGMKEKAEGCIHSLWGLYREHTPINENRARNMYMNICSWCFREAVRNEIADSKKYEVNLEGIYENGVGVNEYEKRALEYVTALSSEMALKDEKKSVSMIHSIMDYMSKNLDDPNLSMNKVAEHSFISTGYLGRVLKKHMGKTYGEYLSELRFNRAKELLRETDLKGYEIGERIGITDAHYLSIWFRKMSGYSLSEYRRMEQGPDCESAVD